MEPLFTLIWHICYKKKRNLVIHCSALHTYLITLTSTYTYKLESPKMSDWKIPQKFYWWKSIQKCSLFVFLCKFFEVWDSITHTNMHLIVSPDDKIATELAKQHYKNWYSNSGLCVSAFPLFWRMKISFGKTFFKARQPCEFPCQNWWLQTHTIENILNGSNTNIAILLFQ